MKKNLLVLGILLTGVMTVFGQQKDINDQTAFFGTLSSDSYTGAPITYTITGDDFERGKSLVEDQDFIVSYEYDGNVVTVIQNAGDYNVILTGANDYTGQSTLNPTVNPALLSSVTIQPIENQNYTGEEIKPVPELMLGTVTLPSTDYVVTYPDTQEGAYVQEGTYTITITGTGASGNLLGEQDITFDIVGNPTGIGNSTADAAQIISSNGTLYVKPSQTSNVSVYNLTGQLRYKDVTNKEVAVSLEKGVYLVKVDGKTSKVVVR